MMQINGFLLAALRTWYHLEQLGAPYWGLLAGIFLQLGWLLRNYQKLAYFWFVSAMTAIAIPAALFMCLPKMTAQLIGRPYSIPQAHLYWLIGGLVGSLVISFLLSRYFGEYFAAVKSWFTRPFSRQRISRTDIRTISENLPKALKKPYDPRKYFRKGRIFLGLSENKKPIYIQYENWLKIHGQILGTTGSGKGVASGVMLSQAVAHGETVVFFDPKNDEFLPHVLYDAAIGADVPFIYLDLYGASPQINLLYGKSSAEIEELLTVGFSLGEKGSDADFYRVEDRRVAKKFAVFTAGSAARMADNFRAFYVENSSLKESAKKFYADLEELAELPCINAEAGISLSEMLEAGAVIYVRGSLRNPKILKAQRMLLLSLIQTIEARARDSARPVCVFLDEFKYTLSRPALEALGAIRDKRAHVIVAHQSLGDLRDCPDDLTAEAVIGAVVDNCSLKISYKVRDPDTADWLARSSGTVLVDDETRQVARNIGLTEIESGEKLLRLAERPLLDVNQLMMLPERCAALFGVGIPQLVFTSPMQVPKNPAAITAIGEPIVNRGEDGPASLGEGLLDVD